MTMTYFGSTAASTAANPPVVLDAIVGGKFQYPGALTTSPRGGKVWFYSSTNAPADVDDAGAFTDGAVLGMSKGDVLIGVMNGGAASTDAYVYFGALNSTESTLSTGAWNICSNYTT
jgi:hypothetical protein